MAARSESSTQASVGADSPSIVVVGLAVFAAVQLGLALFMSASPHGFFTDVGPFGSYNGHYIRDVATFYGASGIGLVVAIRRASWRVPMLAPITMQYGLHSLNHLLDIGRASRLDRLPRLPLAARGHGDARLAVAIRFSGGGSVRVFVAGATGVIGAPLLGPFAPRVTCRSR